MNRREFVKFGLGTILGFLFLGKIPEILKPKPPFLMKYKGYQFVETGYIYAPYIPLYITPVNSSFVPKKGILTRFI